MAKVKDERKYNLGELAHRIELTRQSKIGEPASFSAFEIDTVQSVLETCIDFHPDIPIPDRQRLIWQSISRATTIGVVTADLLLQQFTAAEQNYLRSPVQDYVLATSITINHFPQLTSIRENENVITFSSNLPTQFNRSTIQDALNRVTVIKHPERLTCVRVRVKARTEASAVNQALDCIDFFRGLRMSDHMSASFWNIYETFEMVQYMMIECVIR